MRGYNRINIELQNSERAMGKKNGPDFIEDLNERANHNINPYYWFNRVTPFTMAQWKTNAYFSPLFFFIYSMIGVVWLAAVNQAAMEASKSFWSYFFDFSDATSTARFAGTLLFFVYWVIVGVATIRSLIEKIYAPRVDSQIEHKKEKKKKYPKRPKNYK